jgi:hypothetical protein
MSHVRERRDPLNPTEEDWELILKGSTLTKHKRGANIVTEGTEFGIQNLFRESVKIFKKNKKSFPGKPASEFLSFKGLDLTDGRRSKRGAPQDCQRRV